MHTSRKLPMVCQRACPALLKSMHVVIGEKMFFQRTIQSFSSKLDELWNRIVSILLGPFTMFIYLRYVELTTGFENHRTRLIIFFVLAVVVAAPTVLEGIIAGFFGYGIFLWLQPKFLKGIFGFNWWGYPTAMSAAIIIFIVNAAINIIIIARQTHVVE